MTTSQLYSLFAHNIFLMKQYLFLNSNTITLGSFSRSFALSKLTSKDSIKQIHFCICHLFGMICSFEIKKSRTYVPQINPISLFRIPGSFLKNQVLAFYEDEHKNRNFICRAYYRNLGDHSILARKGVLFKKKGSPKFHQEN